MKTVFALSIVVILLCGCAAYGLQSQSMATPDLNATIVNRPTFDCSSKDDYLVTAGNVYGYADHNELNPVYLIKTGYLLKVIDVYRAGISPSANTVWYQMASPYLAQTFWIDAYKAEVKLLPCAPIVK